MEPIAIVGMACRFPGGAVDPESYWELLRNGSQAVTEVPKDRWDAGAWYSDEAHTPGRLNTRWGGFLQDLDRFDAEFFGISKREAEVVDPQHRLLLEVAWEALERSGRAPYGLAGSATGIYVGIGNHNEYQSLKGHAFDPARVTPHESTGQANSVAAGRVAYSLGLRGPCLSVDTACSSSLVAVYLAAQGLRAGHADLALAGGVNVVLSPEATLMYCQSNMQSPTGRCHAFDARADGYVRAEGCGVVVLARLDDALARGDRILAVLRGAAINQDGASSGGITVPDREGQEAVIRAALADGGVDASEVGYVEAHGTGTRVGDPIEATSLGHVLGAERPGDVPLVLGASKASIGHSEAASGIAGLIKAVLSIQHRELTPHPDFQQPNPALDLDALRLHIPTAAMRWEESGLRTAGVNSFGLSGTNAHVILQEPEPRSAVPAGPRGGHVYALSARNAEALHELAGRHADHLERTELELSDACHTACTTRTGFGHRVAVVGADRAELAAKLRSAAARDVAPAPSAAPRVAFLFSGQGSQYPGMSLALHASEPVFRAAFDDCATRAERFVDRPLLDVLADPDPAVLQRSGYAQPAILAMQVGLLALWRSFGIEPACVLGHSLGEYAAAYAAGVFDLDDAVRAVCSPDTPVGDLDRIHPLGETVAVLAAAERVAPLLAGREDQLALAGFNAPERVLVGGASAALEELRVELSRAGIEVRELGGLVAAHTPLVDPVLEDFREERAGVAFRAPRLPFASTVEGRLLAADEVPDWGYWRRHVRGPIRFVEAIRALDELGCDAFLELGPRHTVLRLGRECVDAGERPLLSSLSAEHHDQAHLLESLAALYRAGAEVRFEAATRGRSVALPTYPFQRKRYWVDRRDADRGARPAAPSGGRNGQAGPARQEALLGERLSSPLAAVAFEAEAAAAEPASEVVLRLLLAARAASGSDALALEDVRLLDPLVASVEEPRRVQVTVEPSASERDEGRFRARVDSLPVGAGASDWTPHAIAEVHVDASAPPAPPVRAEEASETLALDEAFGLAEALRRGLIQAGGLVGPDASGTLTAAAGVRLHRTPASGEARLVAARAADGGERADLWLLDAGGSGAALELRGLAFRNGAHANGAAKAASAAAGSGGEALPDETAELRGRLAEAGPEERRTLFIEYILGVVRDLVGLEPDAPLHPDHHLSELGVDSLLNLDVVVALEVGLGVKLPQNVVDAHPTPSSLAGYLAEQQDL
ncbi:MAG: beta-ketoacyl synthase N-terminal-like domain-containing protein [Planctomycetota bacterium]